MVRYAVILFLGISSVCEAQSLISNAPSTIRMIGFGTKGFNGFPTITVPSYWYFQLNHPLVATSCCTYLSDTHGAISVNGETFPLSNGVSESVQPRGSGLTPFTSIDSGSGGRVEGYAIHFTTDNPALAVSQNLDTLDYTQFTGRVQSLDFNDQWIGTAINLQEITKESLKQQVRKNLQEDLKITRPNPNAIQARFSPEVIINGVPTSIDLTAAAGLFGGTHFNWVNEVTEPQLPVGWVAETVDIQGNHAPAPTPYNDPIDTPGLRYVLTNSSGQTSNISLTETDPVTKQIRNPIPDGKPFVFNENCDLADLCGYSLNPKNFTSTNSISFVDAPGMPKSFNPKALPSFFTTKLVAVTADGIGIDTGIGFNWKSNTITVDQVPVDGTANFISYRSNSNPSNLPMVLGGSVFDIEPFANSDVPEPSTLALSMLAALAIGFWLTPRCSRRTGAT